MPRIKLTERVISTLKGRGATSKSQEPLNWFDQFLPGFGVSVSSKTGLKTYIVQRDLPNGRTVRRKIGRVTKTFSLEQARSEADEFIRQLDRGIDPKAAAKRSITLTQAAEAYLVARPTWPKAAFAVTAAPLRNISPIGPIGS